MKSYCENVLSQLLALKKLILARWRFVPYHRISYFYTSIKGQCFYGSIDYNIKRNILSEIVKKLSLK